MVPPVDAAPGAAPGAFTAGVSAAAGSFAVADPPDEPDDPRPTTIPPPPPGAEICGIALTTATGSPAPKSETPTT